MVILDAGYGLFVQVKHVKAETETRKRCTFVLFYLEVRTYQLGGSTCFTEVTRCQDKILWSQDNI